MKRSPVLRALSVAVIAAVALITPPASAADPVLSEVCAGLHASEGSTITSSAGSVVISGSFTAGEQARFTVTGTSASVQVTVALGPTTSLPVVPGEPVRYDVASNGALQFRIAANGPVSVRVGCGIPPTITGTDDARYSVHDPATSDAACVAHTNPVATCDLGAVDTTSAGAGSYVVTATDTSGLRTSRTFHYTVAKRSQTLHFTTEPPVDAIVAFRYNYEVDAASSSGLPVTLTSDPSTPACHISPFSGGPIYGDVVASHAGTCRIFADQPGNDEYSAAERITMTFQIARELTTLDAAKASKGLLGISGTTFSADLHRRGWFGPSYGAMFAFPGQTVKFYVGGKLICSAVTQLKDDGTFFRGGVATCKAPIGVQAALKYNSYTAVYEGEQDSLPSTAVGKLQ